METMQLPRHFPTVLAFVALLTTIAFASPATAQSSAGNAQGSAQTAAQAAPAARPDDVKSVDAIIAALYDVISGDVGVRRNWDRMRSLFSPGARLIPLAALPGGGSQPRVLTVEDYITRQGPALESLGFREREIARRMEQFGNMVHVWSTYAGTVSAPGATQPPRGINSIQLSHDGTRWWIMNIFWESESAQKPLPARYVPPPA